MRSDNHDDFCNAIKAISIVICTFVYVLNRKDCFNEYRIIRWYLNDIICGYIFSLLVDGLYLFFLNKKIKMRYLFLIILFASIYWEIIYPLINTNSTKDYFDFLSYIGGFLLYFILFCKNYP